MTWAIRTRLPLQRKRSHAFPTSTPCGFATVSLIKCSLRFHCCRCACLILNSCIKLLFWPCLPAAPAYQLRHYYIWGDVDDCQQHWGSFWNCLKLRTKFKDQASLGAIPRNCKQLPAFMAKAAHMPAPVLEHTSAPVLVCSWVLTGKCIVGRFLFCMMFCWHSLPTPQSSTAVLHAAGGARTRQGHTPCVSGPAVQGGS